MARRQNARTELRRAYSLHFEIGLLLSLGILVFAFRSDWHPRSDFDATPAPTEAISVEDITPTDPDRTPPPPPRPAVPIAVPDDELANEDPLNLDPIDLEPILPVGPPPEPNEREVEPDEPEIFVTVEEEPRPVGGLASLYEHIYYPEMARRAGVEGTVIVQFVVDEEGNVVDPRIIRGIGAGLDIVALEAVKKIKFTPGKQRGKAVKVRMSLPIKFRLK